MLQTCIQRVGSGDETRKLHVADFHVDNIAISCSNTSLVARSSPSSSLLAVCTSCVKPGFCPEHFEWWYKQLQDHGHPRLFGPSLVVTLGSFSLVVVVLHLLSV